MSEQAQGADGRPKDLSNNWDEILSLARTHQYDRYIAATLSPAVVRGDLIVLAAFAGEMRRIPWTVSDPTIGMIRLQWWRDCLATGIASITGNPLADAVNEVVARKQLPVGLLIGHVDAQELELYADLVEDLDQLRLHFIKREGALFQLAAQVIKPSPALAEIERAAFAFGLAKTIAEYGFRANGRQLLVPRDMAAAHHLEPSTEPATSSSQDNAVALLTELSELAISEYQACRTAFGPTSRNVLAALLPLTLIPSYTATAKSPFDAANISNMGPGNFAKSWRMLVAYMRGIV